MSRCVRVTAHLSAPLAISPEGFPPHLDALCELIRSRKMRTIEESSGGRHKAKRRGEPVEEPGQIPIPIARERVGELPVPRVSSGIIAGAERAAHYARRFPFERGHLLSEREKGVIRTSYGATKSFRLPLRIVDAPRVVWFARLRETDDGKPARLRKILREVTAIGKKCSQGYGRVARWEVEPVNDDYSWFAPHEEGPVLMRPLPIAVVPDGVIGGRRTFCGVCAPYWQQTFWTEAVEPC